MAAMIGPRLLTRRCSHSFSKHIENGVSVPFELDFGTAATAYSRQSRHFEKFECDTTATQEYRTGTKRNTTGLR